MVRAGVHRIAPDRCAARPASSAARQGQRTGAFLGGEVRVPRDKPARRDHGWWASPAARRPVRGRGRAAGLGSPPPAGRPSGRSTPGPVGPGGRASGMPAAPRKQPGRTAFTASAQHAGSTRYRTQAGRSRSAAERTGHRCGCLGYARIPCLVARVGGEILSGPNWAGFTRRRPRSRSRVPRRTAIDAVVKGAHGGHEAHLLPTDTLGRRPHIEYRSQLGRRPEDLHPARSAFATARVASANARYMGSTSGARSAMAAVRVDRGPVASRDGSGELEAVLDHTPHERDECLGRSAALGESRAATRYRVTRKFRGHAAPAWYSALSSSASSKACTPSRSASQRARSASAVSNVNAAHAPSSCSGPRSVVRV